MVMVVAMTVVVSMVVAVAVVIVMVVTVAVTVVTVVMAVMVAVIMAVTVAAWLFLILYAEDIVHIFNPVQQPMFSFVHIVFLLVNNTNVVCGRQGARV